MSTPTTPIAPDVSGVRAAETQGEVRYGLPLDAFAHAWTIKDIQDYLGIGRTQAYELMQDAAAPPRLRIGRSYRWNGLQVLAWLHHHDWRLSERAQSGLEHPDTGASPRVEAVHLVSPPRVAIVERRPPAATVAPDDPRPADNASPSVRVVAPSQVHAEQRRARIAQLVRPSPPTPTERVS